jgi:oxygen-dependent protoporphyrinogen oxidase
VARVVVVGAGVSGLAAAHRALELRPDLDVVVLESGPRGGGLVRTERTDDGFVIEVGPDSIVTDKPWAIDLARRLGLSHEIIGTREGLRGAYVVRNGKLLRIPDGFSLMAPTRALPVLASPILSWRGKARMALELVLPRGPAYDDESLASFVRRRFGDEVLERLAQPLVGGIYGADPRALSLRATMPRFVEAERRHRSVTLALIRRARASAAEGGASGARYGLFASFRRGTGALPEALMAALGARVRTNCRAVSLSRRASGGFRVGTDGGDALAADAVVVAVPAPVGARLLSEIDARLAYELGAIPMGSAATVTLAFERRDVQHPLDAYGFVVPYVERRPSMAATFASQKWEGRAPSGKVLIRLFLGGPTGEPLLARDDEALVEVARAELAALLGVRRRPLLQRVYRYISAMPQYHVGHLARVARIEERERAVPGLALAGNALHGVGIPDAVRSGEAAAERVLAFLGASAAR